MNRPVGARSHFYLLQALYLTPVKDIAKSRLWPAHRGSQHPCGQRQLWMERMLLSRRHHDDPPSQPGLYLPATRARASSPLSSLDRSPGDLSPAHAHQRAYAPFSCRARIAVLSGVRHSRPRLSTAALPLTATKLGPWPSRARGAGSAQRVPAVC